MMQLGGLTPAARPFCVFDRFAQTLLDRCGIGKPLLVRYSGDG